MRMLDILADKKSGRALSREQIEFFVRGATDDSIPDYQLSALLMAICLRGMDDRETTDLTLAMARSGETVDLSAIGGITADKHSTGGVGDKTTLIVAPIVAACGVHMPKMSGRGLGHTGGTIDKLESIPGFRTDLPRSDFLRIAREVGLCVVGQSGALAPADKRLYALRDVTATVDCMPLIASSVMSKKLAIGADVILLDVKVGSGAFMKTAQEAEALARAMVRIGNEAGRRCAALVTDMDVPLGRNIGNALEVAEAVETLRGGGPEDLREVCLTLAAAILELAGRGDAASCLELCEAAIRGGEAYARFEEMVAAQAGDVRVLRDPAAFGAAARREELTAWADGYVSAMDTQAVGIAAMMLGAGRETKDDRIDPLSGIRLLKKTGEAVRRGEVVAELFAQDPARLPAALERLRAAVRIGHEAPAARGIVRERIMPT